VIATVGPAFEAGAIVLAGGASRRMGQNKCLLPYRGLPLIEHVCRELQPHFHEVLISANDPKIYAFLGLPIVADERPGMGPLGGIAAALARAHYDWNLVVAADMPEIPLPLIALLYARTPGHTCVVPVAASGRREPLFAFYHRSLLPMIRARLDVGHLRIQDLLDQAGAAEVALPAGELPNLNTPDEYRRATPWPPAASNPPSRREF